MSRAARLAAGGLVAAGATLLLVAGSRMPWSAGDDQGAVLRLAWRARAERVEECRPLTEEERAERPAHMRPEEICEGRVLPYRLRVAIDGTVALEDTLHGAGAREDRPIYVYRDLVVEPGTRSVAVEFERVGDADGRDGPPAPVAAAASERDAVPPSLSFSEAVAFEEREIVLVTYDEDRRRLVHREPAGRAARE